MTKQQKNYKPSSGDGRGSDLALHERPLQAGLPGLEAGAGPGPALVGLLEVLLEPADLGAVPPLEVAAAQVILHTAGFTPQPTPSQL